MALASRAVSGRSPKVDSLIFSGEACSNGPSWTTLRPARLDTTMAGTRTPRCASNVGATSMSCRYGGRRTVVSAPGLDAGSRTSAILVQILLAERCGVRPKLESLPLEASLQDTSADAVLLIGDRCIDPPREAFHAVWDLGDEWARWTGLPCGGGRARRSCRS